MHPQAPRREGYGGLLMLRKATTFLPTLVSSAMPSIEAPLKSCRITSPGLMFSRLLEEDLDTDHQSSTNFCPPDAEDGDSYGKFTNSQRWELLNPAKLPIRRSPCLTIPQGLGPTNPLDSPILFATAQIQPSPTTCTFQTLPSSDQKNAFGPVIDSKLNNDFVFKPRLQTYTTSNAVEMGALGEQQFTLAQLIPSSSGSNVQSIASLQASAAALLDSKIDVCEKSPSTQEMPSIHPTPQAPSEDGFNWRKYGQKQVKSSEHPRSYYKCTYPSCQVKKKVERSYDGQITEIIYRGEHKHPRPQSTRRMAMANREACSMTNERINAHGNATEGSSPQGYPNGVPGAPERAQGLSSDDEGENADGYKYDDYGEDDPELKRRKMDDSSEYLSNGPMLTVREPKVVVQTTSDVELLDDGYRWRKYGQKAVKGNDHPRSYYKCTNVGCLVRKQVERSSTDPKAVITAYEGKHNHDVPTSRSSHNNDTSATYAPRTALPPNDINFAVKPAVSLQEQMLCKNHSTPSEPEHNAWVTDQRFWPKNAEKSTGNFVKFRYDVIQGEPFSQHGFEYVPEKEPVSSP